MLYVWYYVCMDYVSMDYVCMYVCMYVHMCIYTCVSNPHKSAGPAINLVDQVSTGPPFWVADLLLGGAIYMCSSGKECLIK